MYLQCCPICVHIPLKIFWNCSIFKLVQVEEQKSNQQVCFIKPQHLFQGTLKLHYVSYGEYLRHLCLTNSLSSSTDNWNSDLEMFLFVFQQHGLQKQTSCYDKLSMAAKNDMSVFWNFLDWWNTAVHDERNCWINKFELLYRS